MCDVNSMTDSVMFGVRFFLVTRMLRGGEGHCRLSSVLDDCMYDGLVREGSSDTCLMSRRREVEEKLRACAGKARRRHGKMRCGTNMVGEAVQD